MKSSTVRTRGVTAAEADKVEQKEEGGPTTYGPIPPSHSSMTASEREHAKEQGERNLLGEKVLVGLFWSAIALDLYLNWHQPRDILGHVIGTIAAGVCIFFFRGASARVGRAIGDALYAAGWVKDVPLRSQVQQRKWIEQSWQLAAHVSTSAVAIYILCNSEANYFFETVYIWGPEKPWGQEHHWLMKPYIYMQFGIWVCTSLLHIFYDERRKDFVTMLAHHVTTVFLVFFLLRVSNFSVWFGSAFAWSGFLAWSLSFSPWANVAASSSAHGYHRFGLLVLLIHDISDIPIDLLKLTNYLQLSGRQGYFCTEIIFIINLISWIVCRLGIYPFHIIRSATFEGPHFVTVTEEHPNGLFELNEFPWKLYAIPRPMYFESYVGLWVLQVLHVWWFYLLLRILVKMCSISPRVASREEYEGASDDEAEEKHEAAAEHANVVKKCE